MIHTYVVDSLIVILDFSLNADFSNVKCHLENGEEVGCHLLNC